MLKKIKQWLERRKTTKLNKKLGHRFDAGLPLPEIYTREQIEKAYLLGYTDGKRDGLTIAREQATKSLKEILWHQNQKNQQ